MGSTSSHQTLQRDKYLQDEWLSGIGGLFTFFCNSEIEGKLFGIARVVFQEDQALVQLWIQR